MELPYRVRNRQKAYSKSFEPNHSVFWGVIVSISGSIFPPNEPNKVWIQEFANPTSILIVKYDNILPVEGIPVLIGPDPEPPYIKIIDVYTATTSPVDDVPISRYTVGLHALNHQWPTDITKGLDALAIFQAAIHILKTSATTPPSTSVYVFPAIIMNDNSRQLFNGSTIDLSDYIPTTGNHRVVLIGLNIASMTIEVTLGVITSVNISKRYPDIPSNTRISSFVTLVGDEIVTSSHIEDTRDFLNYSQSTTYNATNQGDILISNNGSSFEPARPLVSIYTDTIMVTTEGEIITI